MTETLAYGTPEPGVPPGLQLASQPALSVTIYRLIAHTVHSRVRWRSDPIEARTCWCLAVSIVLSYMPPYETGAKMVMFGRTEEFNI
jgi:hypothetical protein